MISAELEDREGVRLVTLPEGENRIGPETLEAWSAMIDDAIDTRASALVVAGTGRHWSTGLDLDVVGQMSDTERRSFLRHFDLLLGSLLTAPLVTVAALNGHTYAGGALLALAFDYRVMREDRGFFCLPSVDVGIPFSPGMSALISAKLPQPIAHDLVVSCRQVGGREASATGVVNRAVPEHAVVDVAFEYGHAFGAKDADTLATVKRRLYPEATAMLTTS